MSDITTTQLNESDNYLTECGIAEADETGALYSLRHRIFLYGVSTRIAAEQAERERCAKIADKHYASKDVTLSPSWYSACYIIANEIREQDA
jgi:hypothetical protein